MYVAQWCLDWFCLEVTNAFFPIKQCSLFFPFIIIVAKMQSSDKEQRLRCLYPCRYYQGQIETFWVNDSGWCEIFDMWDFKFRRFCPGSSGLWALNFDNLCYLKISENPDSCQHNPRDWSHCTDSSRRYNRFVPREPNTLQLSSRQLEALHYDQTSASMTEQMMHQHCQHCQAIQQMLVDPERKHFLRQVPGEFGQDSTLPWCWRFVRYPVKQVPLHSQSKSCARCLAIRQATTVYLPALSDQTRQRLQLLHSKDSKPLMIDTCSIPNCLSPAREEFDSTHTKDPVHCVALEFDEMNLSMCDQSLNPLQTQGPITDLWIARPCCARDAVVQ